MPDILRMLSQAEQLDFSQNFLIPRPNYIGDTIFPDRKTQNFKAEYLRLAAGSQLPTNALGLCAHYRRDRRREVLLR